MCDWLSRTREILDNLESFKGICVDCYMQCGIKKPADNIVVYPPDITSDMPITKLTYCDECIAEMRPGSKNPAVSYKKL